MDQTANYKSAYAQRLKRNCYSERRFFMHLPFPEKLEGTPKCVKWSEMTQNVLHVGSVDHSDLWWWKQQDQWQADKNDDFSELV